MVGFAGRLIREKGVDVFLRAASLVAGVVPEARFVVIGAGRLRGELEALAGDLGLLEERVRFLGFRDDAADLIAALDILAVPSRSDGTPLVVGEAMIAGVPVVVSRVGGLPDQVTHRQTGLVVDPEDPEGLAAALVSLLLAPDEAAARRGWPRIRGPLPHAAFVDRMEELYSQAHQAAAPGSRPCLTPFRPAPACLGGGCRSRGHRRAEQPGAARRRAGPAGAGRGPHLADPAGRSRARRRALPHRQPQDAPPMSPYGASSTGLLRQTRNRQHAAENPSKGSPHAHRGTLPTPSKTRPALHRPLDSAPGSPDY